MTNRRMSDESSLVRGAGWCFGTHPGDADTRDQSHPAPAESRARVSADLDSGTRIAPVQVYVVSGVIFFSCNAEIA